MDVPLEIIVDRSPVTLMANYMYVYAGISYGMMSVNFYPLDKNQGFTCISKVTNCL